MSLSANGAREAGAWSEKRPSLSRPHSAPSPGQQPHLARAVPRVLGVSHVAEAAEQLLHQEQGNLLQDGLLQVGCRRRAAVSPQAGSGARGSRLCGAWCLLAPEPRVPSALLARRVGPAPRVLSATNQELQAAQRGQHRSWPDILLLFLRPTRFLLRVWPRLGSCLTLRLQFPPPAPRLSSDAPDPSDCRLDLAASPAPSSGSQPDSQLQPCQRPSRAGP